MSFYNSSRPDTKPERTTGFGEGLPNFSDARAKLSYDRPVFSERFKNFSPSAKKSGDEILKDLKDQLRREGDMFFNNSTPDWGFSPKSTLFSKADDGEDFSRRSGMDDLRGRHPMFRMPAWMSEDDDMSDLAARMSNTPHFATMGRRGGPWRERRSSGGSAMSATSDDSCDAPTTDKSSQCSGGSSDVPSHEIPIRIEAPCPPSMQQQQQQQPLPQEPQQQPQTEGENEPISPLSSAFSQRKGQYPVRTTSAVDATQPTANVHRSTRCSSAPPEMAEQSLPQEEQKPSQQQRFVSKINITPQSPLSPPCSKSTAIPFSPLPAKFNTVPKPFVSANKQTDSPAAPYTFVHPGVPELPQQQQQQPQNNQQYQAQPPQYTQQPQYQPQQQQYQQPPQQQYQPQQQPQHPSQQQFNPQQQPQQQQSPRQGHRPSIVRNIPIFVEGRDGSVSNEESNTPPKNTSQWGQPRQQQQHFQQQPQPQQPIPQQKTQCRQQTQPQVPQQTQPIPTPVPAPPPPQYQPHPQQQPQSQPQQQPQSQPQQQPQAKPSQPAKDPRLTQIEAVQATVDEYKAKVDVFSGEKNNKEFLYLDEMLTRCLLQLDNVDPDGRDDVRQSRRAVIKNINAAISALEARASDPNKSGKEKTPEASMETDQSSDTKDSQEVLDSSAASKDPANTEGSKEEKMETAEVQEPTSASNEKETTATT